MCIYICIYVYIGERLFSLLKSFRRKWGGGSQPEPCLMLLCTMHACSHVLVSERGRAPEIIDSLWNSLWTRVLQVPCLRGDASGRMRKEFEIPSFFGGRGRRPEKRVLSARA